MKRFALLIVAVLSLVGCSSNSPVAPPDVIYNVTGGEALFKVSLKDQPLVMDTIIRWNELPAGVDFRMHYEIPCKINMDSVLFITFPKSAYMIVNNADSVGMNHQLFMNQGVVFFGIVDTNLLNISGSIDSVLNFYEFFDAIVFENGIIKVFVHFYGNSSVNSNDTTGIINKAKKDLENCWFTFKVYKTVNN